MPKYLCKIIDDTGAVRTFRLVADDEQHARETLAGRGYRILHLSRLTQGMRPFMPALTALGIGVLLLLVALPVAHRLMFTQPVELPTFEVRGSVRGLTTGQDQIRLMVTLPESGRQVGLDTVRVAADGSFKAAVAYPGNDPPRLCSVTVGAEGYAPISHSDLKIQGEPPVVELPESHLVEAREAAPPETPEPVATTEPAPEVTSTPSPSPVPVSTPAPTATPTPEVEVRGWDKMRLVVLPGEGLKELASLGEPMSGEAFTLLGPPASETPASLVWGGGAKMLKIERDKENLRVTRVVLRGLRATTSEGLYLGVPVDKLKELAPEAQKEAGPDSNSSDFLTPGLVLRVRARQLDEMIIEPPNREGWRFEKLVVEPGLGVGPIKLGEKVSAEAYQLLGEPTYTRPPERGQANSGLVRWGTPGHMVEVTTHNGRAPDAVTSITVQGVRAITERKVFLGSSQAKLTRAYPDAKEGLSEDFSTTVYKLPGIQFVLKQQRLVEMRVY
ncbi:MAG: hypothetical protein AB7S38_28325 [Vulcanimicrobiota bacterium]